MQRTPKRFTVKALMAQHPQKWNALLAANFILFFVFGGFFVSYKYSNQISQLFFAEGPLLAAIIFLPCLFISIFIIKLYLWFHLRHPVVFDFNNDSLTIRKNKNVYDLKRKDLKQFSITERTQNNQILCFIFTDKDKNMNMIFLKTLKKLKN